MSSLRTDVAVVDVPMPAMGTSIVEGTVISWSKSVGDVIAVDETICEISTDKVDSECPSPVAGVLTEIVVEAGETVDVGTTIARVAVDGATPGSVLPASDSDGNPKRAPAAEPASKVSGQGVASDTRSDGRRYSPVVRRIAAVHDLDLANVSGTGRGGRVTKRDVLAVVERVEAEPEERPMHSESPYRPDPPITPALVPESSQVREAPAAKQEPLAPVGDLGGVASTLSRIRQSIGSAMLASQATSATAHTVVQCEMTRVEQQRASVGVTALPVVARAVVETLREFGDLNATLEGATFTRFDRVHLGIAVSLGDEGLIVPVIRDAQDLSIEGLARTIKDAAVRARNKQLRPDEVQGATFTITSPGAAGALIATPIIPVPQVGILDMEAITRQPVVVADDQGQESIAIRSMAYFVLGWDHRAIDGMYAARFLTALRTRVEGT